MHTPVDPKVNFPQLEEAVLTFWQEKEIFQQSLQNRAGAKAFIQYDGPPFATGLPHYGHLIQSALKDSFPRYKTMRGFYVERRFGWDCHGLPVEYEVEKELGVAGKMAIEAYGVAKFNEACRNIVLRYADEWQHTINRMGRWVDFNNDYKTMTPNYMESIWWVFKQLWDKDLIEEGAYILPYCPRCSTPLSNHELTMGGYKEVTDQTATVRFALLDRPNTYFMAWTTTPWTLPSNIGIAVGPAIDYVEVSELATGDRYILATKRVSAYFADETLYKVVAKYKGEQLAGLRYQPLMPYFAHLASEGGFAVHCAEYVGADDGTGMVHLANGFGEEDYNALKGTGLPTICPIDEACQFTAEIADYAGRVAKECDKDILKRLRAEGKLVRQEGHSHNLPHCWRCSSPLIYRAISSWFIKVPQIIPQMLKANEEITWIPDHIKEGRFGKWLAGARNWAISRNRYWGNPLPVWRCISCSQTEVMGSRADLTAKSGQTPDDLHSHYIDGITYPCSCGGEMKRIPEVFDCWFESGAMPFAQQHYPFANADALDKFFPADFIVEGIDQTRGWFYTLTVLAVALFDKPAFKMCLTTGLVLAGDGQKMSKSKNNYTNPLEIIAQYGADATRLYLQSSKLSQGDDLKFVDDGVKEMIKTLLLPLWSAYSFYVTYANIDKIKGEKLTILPPHQLDQWILAQTNSLIFTIEEQMDNGNIASAIGALSVYLDLLNNWYIRRSRRRFWKSDNDDDKIMAYNTLYTVLHTFTLVAAPLMPFLTETIYGNLRTSDEPQSVHLCNWPILNKAFNNNGLLKEMELVMQVVTMGHALRSSHNLKNRMPLAKVFVVSRNAVQREVLKRMQAVVLEELNVKALEVLEQEDGLVEYSMKANFKVLGKILGADMKVVATRIEQVPASDIVRLLHNEVITITFAGQTHQQLELELAHVIVQRHQKENFKAINEGDLTVALDAQLTPELMLEGAMRDLVRAIQSLRKERGLEVTDRIELSLRGDDYLQVLLNKYEAFILGETLGVKIHLTDQTTSQAVAVSLGEHEVYFDITKAQG